MYSTLGARALPEGLEVTFAAMEEGANGSNASVATPAPQVYDLVLQAVGRTPNGKKIAADKAGVAVTERGFVNVDIQMRTNVPHIFAIGDIVGQPMLAHKEVHDAHVAAEVIAGELQGNKELAASAFNARVIHAWSTLTPKWCGLVCCLVDAMSEMANHPQEFSMRVTATEAKNRFGSLCAQAKREPVFCGKSRSARLGHSVRRAIPGASGRAGQIQHGFSQAGI